MHDRGKIQKISIISCYTYRHEYDCLLSILGHKLFLDIDSTPKRTCDVSDVPYVSDVQYLGTKPSFVKKEIYSY